MLLKFLGLNKSCIQSKPSAFIPEARRPIIRLADIEEVHAAISRLKILRQTVATMEVRNAISVGFNDGYWNVSFQKEKATLSIIATEFDMFEGKLDRDIYYGIIELMKIKIRNVEAWLIEKGVEA